MANGAFHAERIGRGTGGGAVAGGFDGRAPEDIGRLDLSREINLDDLAPDRACLRIRAGGHRSGISVRPGSTRFLEPFLPMFETLCNPLLHPVTRGNVIGPSLRQIGLGHVAFLVVMPV